MSRLGRGVLGSFVCLGLACATAPEVKKAPEPPACPTTGPISWCGVDWPRETEVISWSADLSTEGPRCTAPPTAEDLGRLRCFPSLEVISLKDVPVEDLSPMGPLPGVSELSLTRTRVADLGPLAGFTGLTSLELANTPVSDLTPLAGLGNLLSLDLTDTKVTDLMPIVGLTGLNTVTLYDTRIPPENARAFVDAVGRPVVLPAELLATCEELTEDWQALVVSSQEAFDAANEVYDRRKAVSGEEAAENYLSAAEDFTGAVDDLKAAYSNWGRACRDRATPCAGCPAGDRPEGAPPLESFRATASCRGELMRALHNWALGEAARSELNRLSTGACDADVRQRAEALLKAGVRE